jgi:hypothetical protein
MAQATLLRHLVQHCTLPGIEALESHLQQQTQQEVSSIHGRCSVRSVFHVAAVAAVAVPAKVV